MKSAGHAHAGGHGHAKQHDHEHHGHHHHLPSSGRALIIALGLTLAYAVVEALAGWWAGSLALISDAGHMFTDSLALGIAAIAATLARRPPSTRHSYGLHRVEALAALANGVGMLLVVGWITWQAVLRLADPLPVQGGTVSLVALIGLAVNLGVAWMLTHGEQNLNTRGALLHVMGDVLGSVAALASGVVISLTGWMPIDPLLSMLISGLILASTLRLLRRVLTTLLEGVPEELSLEEIGHAMAREADVLSVHDLHVWSLASNHPALSAHIVVRDLGHWPMLLLRLGKLLSTRFHIEHATLQPEVAPQQVVSMPQADSRKAAPDR
jgi:cobalt-zinc-cadmium efflux system protein